MDGWRHDLCITPTEVRTPAAVAVNSDRKQQQSPAHTTNSFRNCSAACLQVACDLTVPGAIAHLSCSSTLALLKLVLMLVCSLCLLYLQQWRCSMGGSGHQRLPS